jgi:carboxypeptidase D
LLASNYTDEKEVAAAFLSFWKNFIDTFDMHGSKVSLTGESYAGNYVSKIGALRSSQY